ncbi:MAG: PIN domain nuclease [Puniceicoccaceae bacterium]|nr:MAG: PIN domain nuclease [Puniceicoccaceae bacterium]
MVLIDTSAWIEFFRRDGDPAVKLAMQALIEALEATLCGPVEMEFLGGALPHERRRIQSRFDILPYLSNDQKIWRQAATHYATLRSQGITVPWNDVLVATLALHHNYRTYAVDRHFEIMATHLGLRLYTPGYNGAFEPES